MSDSAMGLQGNDIAGAAARGQAPTASRRAELSPALPSDPAKLTWCRAMLPKVSRTFAACIRLLPPGLADQVLISYLLCRIADTIEDTPSLGITRQTALFADFCTALDTPGDTCPTLRAAFAQPRTDDELLTAEAATTLHEFHALGQCQRDAIRPWVKEMCQGMQRIAAAHQAKPAALMSALDTMAELDQYCYYVAGTVGHLLTELFALHHHRVSTKHYRKLKQLATSFGLGLQLTNIIKDVADDTQRGWSFVPRQLCQVAGIAPEDMLDPTKAAAARQVMGALIRKASFHLREALDYCLCLPRSQYRIRLFCLTPLFFAVRTLRAARSDPRLLDPAHKVKISRAQVYRTLRMTLLVAPNNHLVRAYYRRLSAGSI